MKELQNFVYRHMDALKHHKRYLAMLTALSMLVTFIVPLILVEPADSMTKQRLMLLSDTTNMAMVSNLNGGQDGNVVNGVAYSPAQLSEVSLLIGDGVDWAQGCFDADDVIEAAKREYFLGIASDFCVFLKDDFTPKGSDAEGRVAVGGNVVFDTTEQYNYQLGAGDYTSSVVLKETDNYTGRSNFAHLIMNGNTLTDIAPFGTVNEGNNLASVDKDLYKRFVVPLNFDLSTNTHYDDNKNKKSYNSESHKHYNVDFASEKAQFYGADLINFEEIFDWIESQSEKLSRKSATGTVIESNDPSVVIFDGSSVASDTPTIYFELDSWSENFTEIRFQNVPENANLVINCGGKNINFYKENNNSKISTYVNDRCISKFDGNSSIAKGTDGNNIGNNDKKSEQILYNFYEAETLYIWAHLNGTILAPKADVTSEAYGGAHLSGSMIAKSFEGGLEFGYRPYRGGTDILGSTAGYVVPFDKFVDDLNGNGNDNPRLAGATFEIKDENNNVVDTWTSNGDSSSYVTFPTELDFAGGKTYNETNQTVTHTYTISEKSAPEGYVRTDKKYKVEITETVDLGYLLPVDNGTIPTRVTVNLALYDNANPIGTRTLTIRDGYNDENQHVQRIIKIVNGDTVEYFILTIENGNITNIEKVNNSSAFEELLRQADELNVSFNAVTYSGANILENENTGQAQGAITVDPYPYAYTPENLLTDYNLFAFKELEQGTHVVGAMAAKTLVVGSSYGDAAKAHSYFSNLNGNPSYSPNIYFGSGEYAVDKADYYVYYNDPEVYDPSSNDSYYQRINNNYIDFDSENGSAKTSITSWSNNKATQQDAWVITDIDLTTLDNKGTDDTSDDTTILEIVVSDSTNKNIIIPEAISQQIQRIVFVGENNSNVDLENLADMDFVITLLGTKPGNSTVCGIRDGVPIINFNSYLKYRKDNNDVQIEQAFKNLNGNSNSQQVGLYGLKLIWNLPEVEECFVTSYSGHIVAPKATIELSGGEGSVIANNIKVSQEIHYYPYLANSKSTNAPDEERGGDYNGGSVSDSTGGGTGNESGGTTGGGTNDDETIVPQFPPITDYSAIVTEITITDKKTPQKLTNSNYYYDPTSLMIMPLPDETPSFTNEYALVFKKQSDESTALAGATIELQSGTISNGEFNLSTTHGADSTPPWEWGNETNTYSIPLKKIQVKDLDTNVVYRFFEQTPPEGYEIAKPIYFVKTDNTTIRYTDDETKLSDINSWTAIEFSESNKSSNIITMTDYKKYGPEIKLSKVQIGSSNPLQGAEFVLYAVDGDTLVYPLNDGTKLTSGSDGMIDFTKVFKANPDNCNTEYIKNGYLVPGEYYLEETKAPTDKYEAPTDKMYFVVNENYTVEAEKVEEPKEIFYSVTNVPVGGDKKLNVNKTFDSNQSITKIEVIVDSVNGDSHEIQIKPDGRDIGLQFPLQSGTNIFDKVTHFADKDVYINTNGEISINAWNCSISEIKFYTTSSDTVTIPTEYTLSSEPILSAGSTYLSSSNIVVGGDQPVNVGQTFASNINVNKIVVITESISGDSHQIQIKPDKNDIGLQLNLNQGTNEFNKSEYFNDKNVYINTNGQIYINAWNCVISEMRFYLEGMESTGTCDLTVSNVKAYYIDGTNATAESINALTKKENIIGLEVTLGGSGSGNIQVNDAWKETGVTAGKVVTFGETDYTPPAAETGNSPLISVKDGTTDTLVVGNNKAGATTNISVEKKWSDLENLYNTRTDSITVQLKQDGVNYGTQITLKADNSWKHTWTGIPRLKPNSESETYKYTVEEINAPTGYDVTYSNNSGIDSGQITITNTLKTTNIPVEKKWVDSTGKPISEHPNSVTVKLQKHNGSGYSDFLDKNGNAVTLILSSNNNWAGEFTGIPEGQYQVVESVVPRGWTESRVTENGKTIITNTQKAGALKLTKIWQNDTADQRPENITIKIYRTTIPPTNNNNNGSGGGTTGGGNNVDAMIPSATKSPEVTEDYARLLQYSLYFYDANMCGDEVTENSVYSWRNTNCHTYDGEYAGGFHDAGDHAMFGLPQGFTASTLGWTYNEYKTTFDSLGLKSHYQLIMKEFCDFFVKSTKMSNGSVSDLLLDKGDAGTDHSYWGSPEAQSQGQRGGLVWANSSNSGGNIAAEYAAALASYYLNFPNDSNSSTYLEYAKALYNYSNVKNSPRSIGGIYEDKEIASEQAWAAAWLYLATNEEQYKNDCVNKLNSINFDKRGHFWGEPALGAAIIYTTRIDSTNTTIKNKVTNFLNDKCTGGSFQVLDGWGSARHNTLLQLTALTYDKYQETSSYKDWCKKQMAFILGDNTINGNNNGVCFVTGFKDGDSDTNNDSYLPQHPHHRAASGYNGWNIFNDAKQNGTNTQYKYAHTLIGALVGGPNGNSYNDNIDDTVCNEVAIDYNAGLVGAAAALYSVYETGHTVNAEVMKSDGLELKTGKTIYEEQPQAASINIEDIINTSAMSFKRNAVSVLADNGSGEISIQRYNHSFCSIPDLFKSKCLNLVQVYFNGSAPQDFKFLLKDWEWGTELAQKGDYSISGSVISWEFNGITGIGSFFTEQTQSETLQTYIQKIVLSYSDGSKFEITNSSFVSTIPTITINNAPTQALKIGATHQLSATGTTNTINWTSSDTNIAEVDSNGNVTIKAMPTNGNTVRITATDSTDNTVSASVEIEIEALSLTPPSSNVVIGDKVTYSSNYDGFTIQNGNGYSVSGKEITATNTGNYTVSATYAGSSATAALNVSALQITNLVTPLGVNATHTFGVNGDADGHTFEWISSDPTVLSFDENVPGLATTHKSGNVKIKVIKDGEYQSDEYDVAVQKGALSISVQPTQIRAGGTAELSATNTEGNEVEYSCKSDFITISGNTITAGNVEIQETVVITGALGQESATCNLTIIPLPSISAPDSKNRIGIGETLQLTASNILGTATWRLEDEDTSILIVDENGLVTGVSTGTKTIIVEDTDGTIGTYEITVAELAADPGLPDEPEFYTTVTLTSADLANGNWEKIVNLPIEDGNGQKYYYYIEEVTVNDVVNGNGGKYMPIKYEGQGVTLNEVGSETPEISVTNRLTQTIQGQLPSTGGSGVTTYYYLGGVIMLLSIAGFTGLKRRERKRRKE